MAADRPVTLLIAALGGEGGGVLTDWIVAAAEASGLTVQSTSIPGVAQRTGATSYYIEAFPAPEGAPAERRPVLSLFPSAGNVDLMVASEIVEAGRAIQAGLVTPERTMLIASTHRVYAIGERAAATDGRFDLERMLTAAERASASAMLADFAALAREHGSALNAVLLGLIAASGIVPVPVQAFEDAVRGGGLGVEANLRGFQAGLAFARAGARPSVPAEEGKRPRGPSGAEVEARVRHELPQAAQAVALEGVRRLVDYQDAAYAAQYLDRLAPIAAFDRADGALTAATARYLALWMSYDDIIRVAQLKARPERYGRILGEVRARESEPVRVTEYFKPGVEELASVLPPGLGRRLIGAAERGGWRDKAYLGLHIKTTTVWGFFRVWLLARLRPWRRRTYRFAEEQKAIGAWLGLIARAAGDDPALALEIASCARLIKGYGDTHARSMAGYARIRESVIEPALEGAIPRATAADAVANARVAALSDPTGARLDDVLGTIARAGLARAAE